jgi:oligoendopeptidase F
MTTTTEENLCWDLSGLYAGPDDPSLEEDLSRVRKEAQTFRRDFRGRISSDHLSPDLLAAALRGYESLQRRGLKPYLYAQLLFSADSTAAAHKALMARVRETWSAASEEILFFELEILRIDQERFADLLRDSEVAGYAHYLNQLRAHAP